MEGCSCFEGRPFALQGKYYANLFIHFEPEGGEGVLPSYLVKDSAWANTWFMDYQSSMEPAQVCIITYFAIFSALFVETGGETIQTCKWCT